LKYSIIKALSFNPHPQLSYKKLNKKAFNSHNVLCDKRIIVLTANLQYFECFRGKNATFFAVKREKFNWMSVHQCRG
jgi:hypothetical protein